MVIPPSAVTAHRRCGSALSVAVDTSEIKNGMTLNIDNEPYKVLSFSIMKQARGAAKTTIKFKNLVRAILYFTWMCRKLCFSFPLSIRLVPTNKSSVCVAVVVFLYFVHRPEEIPLKILTDREKNLKQP